MKRILCSALLAGALGLAGVGSHHSAHAATVVSQQCLGRAGGTCGGQTTPPPSTNPPPCLPLGRVIVGCQPRGLTF